MSELLGGNNEEPNENEEFDFDSLDNEWAELNKTLDFDADEVAKRARIGLESAAARNDIFNYLEEHGILCVVDADEEKELDLFALYVSTYHLKKQEELEELGEQPDETFERKTLLEGIYQYFEDREFQATMINHATAFRFALLSPDSPDSAVSYIGMLKKQMQAELLMHYNKNVNDEWYKFFDDMVPAESLDPNASEDGFYMAIAHAGWHEFQHARRQKHKILHEAKVIVGLSEDTDDLEYVAQIVTGLMNLDLIASHPALDDTELANRSAELWSQVRHMPLDNDIAKRVVDYFEKAYPSF